MNNIEPQKLKTDKNITNEEENALNELIHMSKDTIEIKKADKSNVFILMDKEEYKTK